jgi:ribosome modulation factor
MSGSTRRTVRSTPTQSAQGVNKTSIKRAWNLGRSAWIAGLSRDSCPYNFENQSLAKAWREGWDQRNKEHEKEPSTMARSRSAALAQAETEPAWTQGVRRHYCR